MSSFSHHFTRAGPGRTDLLPPFVTVKIRAPTAPTADASPGPIHPPRAVRCKITLGSHLCGDDVLLPSTSHRKQCGPIELSFAPQPTASSRGGTALPPQPMTAIAIASSAPMADASPKPMHPPLRYGVKLYSAIIFAAMPLPPSISHRKQCGPTGSHVGPVASQYFEIIAFQYV